MRRVLNYVLAMTLSLLVVTGITNAQTFGAGHDFWQTDSSITYDDVNLPANAIAPGSNPYQGRVYLKGNPQPGNQYDTSIKRQQSVSVPGTTTLLVDELNMVSVSQLDVSFSNGPNQNCDMYVTKSPSLASKGSMTINQGGTFSSSLKVIPKLTFVCSTGLRSSSSKGKTTTVLDTGSPLVQAVMKMQARAAQKRVSEGLATRQDEAIARACAEPVPTETQPTQTARTTTSTRTKTSTELEPAPTSNCGINFTADGTWTTCGGNLAGGGFCIPAPLSELALLAKHGVIPIWFGVL